MNQLVNKGFESYIELTKLVNELYNIINSSSKSKKIHIKQELENIDIAIQYGLIQIAIIDYSLSKEEIEYIKSIWKYKDFISYLQDTKFNGTTYQVLYLAEKEELEELIKQLHDNVLKLITPFITALGTIDVQLKNKKYLERFKTYLEDIVNGMLYNTKNYNFTNNIDNSFFNEIIQKVIEVEINYNKPLKKIKRAVKKILTLDFKNKIESK